MLLALVELQVIVSAGSSGWGPGIRVTWFSVVAPSVLLWTSLALLYSPVMTSSRLPMLAWFTGATYEGFALCGQIWSLTETDEAYQGPLIANETYNARRAHRCPSTFSHPPHAPSLSLSLRARQLGGRSVVHLGGRGGKYPRSRPRTSQASSAAHGRPLTRLRPSRRDSLVRLVWNESSRQLEPVHRHVAPQPQTVLALCHA